MKLNELHGIKKMKSGLDQIDDLSELDAMLKTHDFNMTYKGSHSRIYTNPKLDYIVKVFKNDPCYMKFISFALKNQNNPHLPKIKGKIIKLSDDISAVRIERLSLMKSEEYLETGMRDFLFDLNDGILDGHNEAAEEFERSNSDFADTCYILYRQLASPCEFDFGYDNIMKRGSTYVITDPFAG